MAVATGAAEKGVAQVYETAFRPAEKRHRPWTDRCHAQMRAALSELDRAAQARSSAWLAGNRLGQADITATCVYAFLVDALLVPDAVAAYPGLAALAERCEALPEFRLAKGAWSAPAGAG